MCKQTTEKVYSMKKANMIVGEELDKRYAGDSRGRKANKMEAH